MALDDNHRQYLNDHAVPDEVIERHGIHSVDGEIVFPWVDGDRATLQRRPWPGESGLYFWEADSPLHFWTLRDAGPSSPVLLIEGTKQALAGSAVAPAEYTVLGMAGCWGWSKEKLTRFKGRTLVICLDADAGSNLDVYDAGDTLAEKVKRFGAEPQFLRFPGTGTQGLDDYLATVDESDRADVLAYEIANAKGKPAERRPTTRKRKMSEDIPDTGGRVGVAVNLDRKEVIDKITGALKAEHDGRTFFNYGDVLTRVRGHSTQPLDRDSFYGHIADTVACYRYSEATDKRPAVFEPTWPDPQTIGAVMSKAEEFSLLRRVVRVPFLRPDGSVCFTPGYDRETATVLVPGDLDDVAVPDAPTAEETRMAAKFLMDEWLGDMPFKTAADRANALALVLTPFIRGVVPLAPLAVVSGLQMGVGKNLLADCLAILATGATADPLPYVTDDEEMRKMITSAFASGAELFVFDEAHEIQGAQLARAVTSLTYNDRILGVSRLAKYPNAVTWLSLGNQVKVNGDMSRRVFFIYLHPSGRDVIDREASSFRHPDLKSWTADNRPALVSAALTVLRGWVAAGRPSHSRGATMGSFEAWDRMLSGVLAHAGYPEFLTDVKERRSESDYATAYWEAHVHWLSDTFGRATFTTKDVQRAALANPAGWEAPPGLEDASGKQWTRALGRGYGSHADRDFNGVRLIKAGMGHKSTNKWATVTDGDKAPANPEVVEGDGGTATPLRVTGNPIHTVYTHDVFPREGGGGADTPSASTTSTVATPNPDTDGHSGVQQDDSPSVLAFDIETASAPELFTGRHEGPFVRLFGIGYPEDHPLDSSIEPVDHYPPAPFRGSLDRLSSARILHGHNAFHFDLIALARHCGADYDALAAKTVDTMTLARLLDPPGARGMKPWSQRGYYSLDAVAQRLGVDGKTADLAALAAHHGGYDKIPTDDPDYHDYLCGDLSAQRAVFDALSSREWSQSQLDYAKREMRVQALQGRMTLNGWRIDTDLLAERVRGEEERVEGARQKLAEWGVPLRKPDRYKLRLKKDWPEDRRGVSAAAMREILASTPDELVAAGVAERTPGETYAAPWGSDAGRDALVQAFHDAGAEHVPRTRTGALALSADALGEGTWVDHEGKSRPGMLKVYGHLPGVRSLCETLALATGASAKYAEIARYTTAEGRVHPETSAPQASGRWATLHPANGNTGKRGAAAAQRAVYVPDHGHVHLTCDLAQVDMRGVAALSQDRSYMDLFTPGRDAHMEMAEVYFGQRTKETRQRTKAINHGLNYGQSAAAVAERNGLPLDLVESAVRARAEAFPRLVEWTMEVRELAQSGALLDNGFGRLMRPDPERAWTQGPALMGQGCARDLMCESLLRLVDARPDVTPYLRGVVHDEVILSVPAEETEEWQEELRRAFTWEWRGVPILCDVSEPATDWEACYAGE